MAKLSARQEEILVFGRSQASGKGFACEFDEFTAWSQHRGRLMQLSRSCERPAAYLTYEVRNITRRYCEAIEALRRRHSGPPGADGTGLFDQMPAMVYERGITVLSPRQPGFMEQIGIPEVMAGLSLAQIEGLSQQFLLAQAWHAFRGDEDLACKYERLGSAVRSSLLSRLRPLSPALSTGALANPGDLDSVHCAAVR
jgi:hypothetical protein